MVKGNNILKALGKEKLCKWILKNGGRVMVDLRRAGLCGADLRGANLYEADLCGADLRGANLHGANLHVADLSGANLSGANLSWADLRRADLRRADLYGADLYEANLSGADLHRSNLHRANLHEANLDFSCWPLWCGSSEVDIDEKQAKQILAHTLKVAEKYWPGGITKEQKEWLNSFHRIVSKEFPEFE